MLNPPFVMRRASSRPPMAWAVSSQYDLSSYWPGRLECTPSNLYTIAKKQCHAKYHNKALKLLGRKLEFI